MINASPILMATRFEISTAGHKLDTSVDTVEGYHSQNNVNLAMAAEGAYPVEFTEETAINLNTSGRVPFIRRPERVH